MEIELKKITVNQSKQKYYSDQKLKRRPSNLRVQATFEQNKYVDSLESKLKLSKDSGDEKCRTPDSALTIESLGIGRPEDAPQNNLSNTGEDGVFGKTLTSYDELSLKSYEPRQYSTGKKSHKLTVVSRLPSSKLLRPCLRL